MQTEPLDAVANTTLNTGGAVVMTLSIACVLLLLTFCLYRVFTLPPVE